MTFEYLYIGTQVMFYTVYRTVNLANGKYYFGVHKTEYPNDGYLGSGNYIKRAIAKYGEPTFKKEVLFIYLDPESAFGKEDELIQCYRGRDPLCMNLRKGGSGGFDWINKNGLVTNVARKLGMLSLQKKIQSDPVLQEKMLNVRRANLRLAPPGSLKIATSVRALQWKGKKHSVASCKKMQAAALARGKTYQRSPHRREGPEGTAWCERHKLFLPVSDFYKNATRWNGLQARCIECIKGTDLGLSSGRMGFLLPEPR
jgi:hypothetical protein